MNDDLRYSLYTYPTSEHLCNANSLAEAAILIEAIRIQKNFGPFRWKYYDSEKKQWFVPDANSIFNVSSDILLQADLATDSLPGK